METAQEREVQLLQGRQAWPFHHMMGMGMGMPAANAGGCFDGYGGGVGGDCFVLGWAQPPAPAPFGCFGLLAADVHDLFPLFAGMESPLPVSSSALAIPPPPPPPAAHDAVAAIPGDLDDLLLNFWDASCCHDGDVGEQQKAMQQQVDAFNSTCVTHEQTTTTTTCAAAATTNSFFHYDDGDDPLSSIFCTGGPTPLLPLPAEKAVAFQHAPAAAEPAEPLPSSSSSNCHGAQPQSQGAAATPRTPPLPRSSTSTPSLKRATREAESSDLAAECSQQSEMSSKRRRMEAPPPAPAPSSARVLCPFALLKPDGLDGGETLADINARILMRPTRPVRHPVGEFACAPRVSADQPGLSGKAVSSFTRLHTPGRGTITIIRTRD